MPPICSLLVRTGAAGSGTIPPYGIADFIQGSVNGLKLYTRGLDYQFIYRTDSNVSFNLNGNYVFKGLAPGLDYQVQFFTPTGFDAASPRQQGASEAIIDRRNQGR